MLDVIPIDCGEEWMLLYLKWALWTCAETSSWVTVEQGDHQVFGLSRNASWQLKRAIDDIIEELIFVSREIWRSTDKHLVQKYSEEIPIDRFTVTNSPEHFWSQVSDRPAEGFGTLAHFQDTFFGKTEIGEEGMAVIIEDDVIGFEISIDDIPFV